MNLAEYKRLKASEDKHAMLARLGFERTKFKELMRKKYSKEAELTQEENDWLEALFPIINWLKAEEGFNASGD